MRFSTQIKPISYVKAHAAELLEARAVLLDVASYEEMMDETQALLKVLAMAEKEIENGDTIPIEEVMAEFGVESQEV